MEGRDAAKVDAELVGAKLAHHERWLVRASSVHELHILVGPAIRTSHKDGFKHTLLFVPNWRYELE